MNATPTYNTTAALADVLKCFSTEQSRPNCLAACESLELLLTVLRDGSAHNYPDVDQAIEDAEIASGAYAERCHEEGGNEVRAEVQTAAKNLEVGMLEALKDMPEHEFFVEQFAEFKRACDLS